MTYVSNKVDYLILKEAFQSDPKPRLYEFVPIDIPRDTYARHQEFDISRTTTHNYFGKIQDFASEEIVDFLKTVGANSDSDIRSIYMTMLSCLDKYVRHHEQEYAKHPFDSAWIAIRAFTPTDAYKVPRWHHDGGKFWTKMDGEGVYKFATALVGAGTLVAELTPEEYVTIYSEMKKHVREGSRIMIEESVDKMLEYEDNVAKPALQKMIGNNYDSVPDNHAMIFLCDDMRAPIHSEPHIDRPRLFFSIMLGTSDQIAERKNIGKPPMGPKK